jgi:hypothetical protein
MEPSADHFPAGQIKQVFSAAPVMFDQVPAGQAVQKGEVATDQVPAWQSGQPFRGGSCTSDTGPVPLGHDEVVGWQSMPRKGLLLAVHDPLKGATEHGLKAQVVGLTYLSAPIPPHNSDP